MTGNAKQEMFRLLTGLPEFTEDDVMELLEELCSL